MQSSRRTTGRLKEQQNGEADEPVAQRRAHIFVHARGAATEVASLRGINEAGAIR